MPFENGCRKLIRERPPLLKTPFEVFDQGVFTPNDQFFARWHLPVIPNQIDVDTFRLRVDGHVRSLTEFKLGEILRRPDQVGTCRSELMFEQQSRLLIAARAGWSMGQRRDGQRPVDGDYAIEQRL